MTDQPDHRPAPGTALGPPARVHAVPDDGRGDRVVLQGGTAVALQQLFAGADAPEPLLAAFANGMATLPGELGDMGDRLQSAQASADWPRYGRAMRQLIDKYIRTTEQHSPDPQPDSLPLSEPLRLLLGGPLVPLPLPHPHLRQPAPPPAATPPPSPPRAPPAPRAQGLRALGHPGAPRPDSSPAQHPLAL